MENTYIRKPKHVKAVRWFKNGDHPRDYEGDTQGLENGELVTFTGEERKRRGWEGSVVRYYRFPKVDGADSCTRCDNSMHDHGWIEKTHNVVCPGDYIITDEKGNTYACSPAIFEQTYEEVTDD